MNVVVGTDQNRLVKTDWTGGGLETGEEVGLRVSFHDPRCVMTIPARGDLPKATGILRTLVGLVRFGGRG
jgi:hypothetical protein